MHKGQLRAIRKAARTTKQERARRAATSATDAKILEDLCCRARQTLEVFVETATECSECSGSGLDPFDKHSACRNCGGSGELCEIGTELGIVRDWLKAYRQRPTL